MKTDEKTQTPATGANDHDKVFNIIVNARPKTTTQNELSFDDVVTLAFGPPNYETSVYTVTYQKGEDKKPKGTLVRGESVHVKDGMIFDVIRTDKS
jgi:hypothetical protein